MYRVLLHAFHYSTTVLYSAVFAIIYSFTHFSSCSALIFTLRAHRVEQMIKGEAQIF